MKGFRLDSRHDVSELIKEIKQLEPPVLVVIDTLQSVAGEWNLNRTDQAGKLSMALNDIRNAGATVFIVHHMSSKIEDAKGIVLGEGSLMSRAMGNTTIVAKCDTLVGICQLFKQPDKITFALRIVERRTELAVPERFAVELVKSGPGSIALAYQKDIPSLPTSNAARLSMLFIGSPKDRFTVRQVSGKTGEVLSMRETRAALRELEGAGVLVMGRARHNQYKYGLGKNFRAMNTSYAEALRAESGKKKR